MMRSKIPKSLEANQAVRLFILKGDTYLEREVLLRQNRGCVQASRRRSHLPKAKLEIEANPELLHATGRPFSTLNYLEIIGRTRRQGYDEGNKEVTIGSMPNSEHVWD